MDAHMTLSETFAKGLKPRRFSNEKSKPGKVEFRGDNKSPVANGDARYALGIRMESPPLVSYGRPEDSTGSLLSGILDVTPLTPATSKDGTFEVERLEMRLIIETETQRPMTNHCPQCKVQQQ